MKIKFTWDDTKAELNRKKHNVTFEEASEVFFNFPLEVFHDPESSDDELRYIATGFSNSRKSLLVVHCENATGNEIRIISARRATKKERKQLFGE